MSTDPDQIRAQIDELLAGLPDHRRRARTTSSSNADIEEIARRLAEAHDVLVHALESVEKG